MLCIYWRRSSLICSLPAYWTAHAGKEKSLGGCLMRFSLYIYIQPTLSASDAGARAGQNNRILPAGSSSRYQLHRWWTATSQPASSHLPRRLSLFFLPSFRDFLLLFFLILREKKARAVIWFLILDVCARTACFPCYYLHPYPTPNRLSTNYAAFFALNEMRSHCRHSI